ncbi:MAG: Bug family tripartite tricarboxylate transporter substrate binding protein [Burkholderiales bacterium]
MRKTASMILAAAAGLLLAGTAAAQDAWPSRTITIVGGFPTGAGTDIYSRMLAEPLGKALGVSVIIDNKSGAGGNVGSEFVARARPDGYTLYFGTAGTHAINVSLYGKLPFDVIRDFTHVSILGDVPNIMIVNPKVMPDVNSCADMMKLAREKPGQFRFASTGNGASTHLAGAAFTKMSGVDIEHIPYRGTPPAMNAMMSGETQVMWHQSLTVMGPIRQGVFNPLAVTTREPIAALPDVPTVEKACGIPGFESTTWYGLLAPANLPDPILRRLNREVVAIVSAPEFQKRLNDLGITPMWSTPEEFRRRNEADIEAWRKVVADVGAKLD